MPKATSTSDRFLGRIFAAAKAHGEQSEPDHLGTHEEGDLLGVLQQVDAEKRQDAEGYTVTDLKDVLLQCWNVMDPIRRQAIGEHWIVKDLLEEWEPQ
jgi:hypothetical protein